MGCSTACWTDDGEDGWRRHARKDGAGTACARQLGMWQPAGVRKRNAASLAVPSVCQKANRRPEAACSQR